LAVALGGGLGAVLRFVVATATMRLFRGIFPLGTFLINCSGSFAIGALMTLFINRSALDGNWRLFLVTGVLGGYTTFSSFEWETVLLIREGSSSTALFYVASSVMLGLMAAWVGILLGEKIWPR
jgi:CrcB protein